MNQGSALAGYQRPLPSPITKPRVSFGSSEGERWPKPRDSKYWSSKQMEFCIYTLEKEMIL